MVDLISQLFVFLSNRELDTSTNLFSVDIQQLVELCGVDHLDVIVMLELTNLAVSLMH